MNKQEKVVQEETKIEERRDKKVEKKKISKKSKFIIGGLVSLALVIGGAIGVQQAENARVEALTQLRAGFIDEDNFKYIEDNKLVNDDLLEAYVEFERLVNEHDDFTRSDINDMNEWLNSNHAQMVIDIRGNLNTSLNDIAKALDGLDVKLGTENGTREKEEQTKLNTQLNAFNENELLLLITEIEENLDEDLVLAPDVVNFELQHAIELIDLHREITSLNNSVSALDKTITARLEKEEQARQQEIAQANTWSAPANNWGNSNNSGGNWNQAPAPQQPNNSARDEWNNFINDQRDQTQTNCDNDPNCSGWFVE